MIEFSEVPIFEYTLARMITKKDIDAGFEKFFQITFSQLDFVFKAQETIHKTMNKIEQIANTAVTLFFVWTEESIRSWFEEHLSILGKTNLAFEWI